MKTITLSLMLVFVNLSAVNVFALTHQEKYICAATAGNCMDRVKLYEKRIVEIRNKIKETSNNDSKELQRLENELEENMTQLENAKSDY